MRHLRPSVISAFPFPSFVRRGEGEVEAGTRMPLCFMDGWLYPTWPPLTKGRNNVASTPPAFPLPKCAPYKGEGAKTVAQKQPEQGVVHV